MVRYIFHVHGRIICNLQIYNLYYICFEIEQRREAQIVLQRVRLAMATQSSKFRSIVFPNFEELTPRLEK